MPPVARSAQSRPSIMVGIIIGCIVGVYFVVVTSYYLYCSIVRTFFARKKRRKDDTLQRVDFISASGRPKKHPDLYTTPVMRYRFLFRRIYPGRPRSPFDIRRIVCLTPSPLRHLLASRLMDEESLLPDSLSKQALKIKASSMVTVICSLDYMPPYDGPYPLGTVTHTLGKPVKGVCGEHANGKENEPIPEVLIQERSDS